MELSKAVIVLLRVSNLLLHNERCHIILHFPDCFFLFLAPVITVCVTGCMRAVHSPQVSGAAEEIQPMLFAESASTPAISSTPFTLAPPCWCESKSSDFLLRNICCCFLG